MIVVGVDGGATSTKVLALSTSTMEASIARSGPSNPVNVGPEKAGENIGKGVLEAVRKLGARLDDIVLVYAGLAGLDSRRVKDALADTIKHASGLGERLVLDHDAYISLLAATRGRPGILVIAGTGSIVFAYDGARRLILGDRGWLLGDEGSGFWVARLALRRLRRALDGLIGHDCMTSFLTKRLGVRDTDELMYWFYNNQGVEQIASVTRYLAEIAENCAPARSLFEKGARLLAALALEAAKWTGLQNVYVTGSMFRSNVFMSTFRNVLEARGISVHENIVYAVLGAVYEALRLAGDPEPDKAFSNELYTAARNLYE
ncbi:BadF/BadG/BcrA/BcrD ATPase family protein [Pyrofollis japonicus]|uniref:BadF/BadG/BcrA/BcrD ATPase family protein n=1 Tax=Pyrofollis japonicus TaxID=3060460 RepID=UPI00295BD75C|nr:BadF/BadG/BcrA/BcrD ATPase family protein [Pyrofollis japonicus]BEP18134.1 BadF/BadG/BcrA/BcrD ATPase family protein [Pyrofollis japonicus]